MAILAESGLLKGQELVQSCLRNAIALEMLNANGTTVTDSQQSRHGARIYR